MTSVAARLALALGPATATAFALAEIAQPQQERMQSSAWPSSAPHQLAGVGVVTYLVDGDTIVMDLGERQSGRIRYIGIDTPERGRPSYAEAKEANRRLVATRLLLLADDVQDTDGSRLLRYVCLEDGTFVNAELVR